MDDKRNSAPDGALPDPQAITGAAADLLQTAREILGAAPALRQQYAEQAKTFRQAVSQSVGGQLATALQQVAQTPRQQLQSLGQTLAALPAENAAALNRLLGRVQSQTALPPIPVLASDVRQAGLDQPLPTRVLVGLGVSGEDELLRRGLGEDLLPILRSVVALHAMAPGNSNGADVNCIPYGMVTGYLYEALMCRHFHRLFRTLRLSKSYGLSAYDRVDWTHCTAFAGFRRYRSADLRALTPGDWAAWLNLLQCCRQLRNRIHSDDGTPGFISRKELDAFHALLLSRGSEPKLALLALPCFAPDAPSFGHPVWPVIPPEWPGATPAEPHRSLAEHIQLHFPSFRMSLLDFLLSCADFDDAPAASQP